jgi:lipopolysaccharide export system permease protein
MRLIDKYIVGKFIKTSLFALLSFAFIFILVDMVEKVDDFIDQDVSVYNIGKYYVYFLPRIFSLVVPVALLLSSLIVVGKMSSLNELTIVKCGGVSLYRIMAPFVIIGLLVSLGMTVFDGWGVPKINTLRIELEREYLKKNLIQGGRYNMFFQDSDNRIVSLEYYDIGKSLAKRVSIQSFDKADPTIMVRRSDAESMRWNEASKSWTLIKGYTREFSSDTTVPIIRQESIAPFDSVLDARLLLRPSSIIKMQQKPEEMELGDFGDYIDRQRNAGSDIARLLVDYHGKIAFSFASLVVVFFAVPFASVKRRSGVSVQFGISILICFTYLVGQKLSQVFGYNGAMPPLLAAWLPNMIFFLAGLYVTVRVPK